MSDDVKHEQPSAGGRYIRQLDGSLVREEAPTETPADTETSEAPAARSAKKLKGN